MPNHTIPTQVHYYIKTRAINHSRRALDYAIADFPLSTAQVQAAVVQPDILTTMRDLANKGVQTLQKHENLRFSLTQAEPLLGLKRGVVLSLVVPEPMFVTRSTSYGMHSPSYDDEGPSYIVPDLTHLDAQELAQLKIWIKRALRQTRLHGLVVALLDDLLPRHAPTVAHLRALWPNLVTMLEPGFTSGNYHMRKYEPWAHKLRETTRTKTPYLPERRVKTTYGLLIAAADQAIMAGQMLEPFHDKKGVVRACVEHWEHFDTDLKIPIELKL